MRIIFDLQGCQSEGSRVRGIGRYSINLIKTFIRLFPNEEYILFANAFLYDLHDEFQDELTNESLNIFYFNWYPVSPTSSNLSDNSLFINLSTELRSYIISRFEADILLITSFFEGYIDNCVTALDLAYSLPWTASIIYDLIPLINPESYLNTNPLFNIFYRKQIEEFKKLDYLFAISQSALREGIQYLGFSENKIHNISSACETNKFFETAFPLDETKNSFTIDGDFILYTGAGDPRKNLYRLVEAYSLLPSHLICKYKLVLAGKLIPEEIALIFSVCKNLNLPKEYIVLLGFVTDEELLYLYRKCYLFVFPSFHEGFGLPVLEAINCGAVVIGSNISSIPEVINYPKALFDPYNINSIKSLIEKVLTDPIFYEELRSEEKKNKEKFSWEKTVKLLYEKFVEINKNPKLKTNVLKSKSMAINRIHSSIDNLINSSESLSDVYKCAKSSLALMDQQIKDLFVEQFDSTNRWLIEGPFDSSYSLSILNKNLALALSECGTDVSINSSDGPGDYIPNNIFLDNNPSFKNLYEKSFNPKYCIASRNMYPPRVNDMKGNINLLHSYGWEESEFPYEWVSDFNLYLDGLTVMSNQVKNVMIANGVAIPIEVAPLGLDHLDDIIPEKFNLNTKNYTFLHISSCFPRKGLKILLESYGNAFTSSDDVTLIIKTFANPHNNVNELVDKFKLDFKEYPHILVITEELSDAQVKGLYQSSNCLVAPSYGEGFGLPIGEAMREKISVITTAFGGQRDFCSTDNSWLIDYEFDYADTHFDIHNSVWAVPNKNHLKETMLYLFSSKDKLIDQKIEKAKLNISAFTWKASAEYNKNFTKGIIDKKAFTHKQTRLGVITTWNVKCGISSYAKNLFSNFKEYFCILASKDSHLIAEDFGRVVRCWDINNSDYSELFVEISVRRLTTVVFNFNFAFFNYEAFSELLIKLNRKNINIIIIFHSTNLSVTNSSKSLQLIKNELLLCKRILVHTPKDLNVFKKLDLIENVSLFPHGVHIPKASNSQEKKLIFKKFENFNKPVIISTFGFCLPNKGYQNLIEAIKFLIDDNFNVKLNMYCSEYSSDFKYLIKELNDLVLDFSLEDKIIINSEYLDDLQIHKNLSSSDLIVFPYQQSFESSSASVRQGIASGKPVIVTPSSIFHDVSSLVYFTQGFSSDDIYLAIKDYLNKTNQFKLIDSKSHDDKVNSWINQTNFSRLSERFRNMIKALEIND